MNNSNPGLEYITQGRKSVYGVSVQSKKSIENTSHINKAKPKDNMPVKDLLPVVSIFQIASPFYGDGPPEILSNDRICGIICTDVLNCSAMGWLISY